ncbi:MAG: glycosyltransferase [Mangrovibacterium sp.]
MTISIITVTRNDCDNLEETFSSLNAQSDKNFEWIIKDGQSTDNTREFYDRYINAAPLNSIFITEADKSVYDAMNQAVKYTKNRYLLFLNAGDQLESNNTIERVLNVINSSSIEYSFIYGDVIDITPSGEQIYKKARGLKYLSHSIPTSHQSIFYNRDIFNSYKYDTSLKIAADYALSASVYFDGNDSFLKLDFPICRFYLGGLSTARRNILLKEGYRVHRQIVKDNLLLANFKYFKRLVTFYILDNFPRLYRVLRGMADKRSNNQNTR